MTLALPVGIAVMVAVIAGQIWWMRRHPAPPRAEIAVGPTAVQAEAAITNAEWVRGIVAVGAVCALMVAGVVLLYAVAPR